MEGIEQSQSVDQQPLEAIFGVEQPGVIEKVAEPPSAPPEEPQQEDAAPEIAPEPVKEIDDTVKGLQAALVAERRLRQQAEAKALQQQEPLKDVWVDPEGRLQQQETKINELITRRVLNMSEAAAREKYKDFDEKFDVFAELTQEQPYLIHQMNNAMNPAEFMYKTAEKSMLYKEIGDDVGSYRAKIAAEERLKLEQEFNKKIEERVKQITSLPGSAANLRSRQMVAQVTTTDPLGDIFGRK